MNIVNSVHLAKVRDIDVVVSQSSASKGFTNRISVTLKTEDGKDRRIAGTLLKEYGARIVRIDKFPVDIAPEGNLIFISHNDKPGIVGSVGTLLGKNDVNIASMQVGRKIIGGEAIMVLTVDKTVSKEVLDELVSLQELNTALQIEFKS